MVCLNFVDSLLALYFYLGELIFKGYSLSNFVDLAYVYGRSNESVVHTILNTLGELNSDKVIEQFSESITTISKHI